MPFVIEIPDPPISIRADSAEEALQLLRLIWRDHYGRSDPLPPTALPVPHRRPLAQRLTALRKRAGLSMTELADAAGTTQSQVSKIERGKTLQPAAKTMRGLRRALMSHLRQTR